MESKYWRIDPTHSISNHPAILAAAEYLKQDEVVAFPTETVYGLGANALSDQAVQKIFQAKGRPSDNPLIIHVQNIEQAKEIVQEIPEKAKQLFQAYSPGPITIILKSNGRISPYASAGLTTIGIRIPDHPVALELLRVSGLPLAAPSANLSGKPSPTKGEHVWRDLAGRIAGVLDVGETGVGVESTVIDLSSDTPIILRPGGITKEQIEEVIGAVEIDPAIHLKLDVTDRADQSEVQIKDAPRSPGMKYTHYAPQAPLWVSVCKSIEEQKKQIARNADRALSNGMRVGILTTKEGESYYRDAFYNLHNAVIIPCGSREDLTTVARSLYDVLRRFDEEHVQLILSETFPSTGLGTAIMNRLCKASGGKVLKD